jgi:hypothetical protein
MWMQDGCKAYMDSYLASNGSCFMVTWIIFKNHLLEVGLRQSWETMALRMHHNRWFILFYHVWGPAWIKFIEATFGWGSGQKWLHTTLEGPLPHYMILEVPWGSLWTISCGLSQFHGHSSWLMCEVSLSMEKELIIKGGNVPVDVR